MNGNNLVSTYAAPVTGLKVTPGYTSLTATWKASSPAPAGGYQVTVTSHQAVVTTVKVTGTSYRLGHLKQKTSYGVHVLALPQAPGQKATTAYVTTK